MDIFEAARAGDLDAINELLEGDGERIAARDAAGRAPLLAALYARQPDAVALLVDRGAVPNLWESAAVGDAPRLAELLDAEPGRLAAHSHDGWTPLHLAAFFGQIDAVRELVGRGADPAARATNATGNTPLHAALAGGLGVAGVEYLLLNGAEIDARQAGGYTVLHSAAMHGDVPMIEMLLAHGADPSIAADDGRTAAAMARGHAAAAALLE